MSNRSCLSPPPSPLTAPSLPQQMPQHECKACFLVNIHSLEVKRCQFIKQRNVKVDQTEKHYNSTKRRTSSPASSVLSFTVLFLSVFSIHKLKPDMTVITAALAKFYISIKGRLDDSRSVWLMDLYKPWILQRPLTDVMWCNLTFLFSGGSSRLSSSGWMRTKMWLWISWMELWSGTRRMEWVVVGFFCFCFWTNKRVFSNSMTTWTELFSWGRESCRTLSTYTLMFL